MAHIITTLRDIEVKESYADISIELSYPYIVVTEIIKTVDDQTRYPNVIIHKSKRTIKLNTRYIIEVTE